MQKKLMQQLRTYELPPERRLSKIVLMRAPKEQMYATVDIKGRDSIIVMPGIYSKDEFVFDFGPLGLSPSDIEGINFYTCLKEDKKKK